MVPEGEFDDPNLDKSALALEDDSPYPEVRSAVANTDDPSIPVSTLRSWVIGLIFAIVMSGLNQFFFFRYPSVTIGNVSLFVKSFAPQGKFSALLPPLQWTLGGAASCQAKSRNDCTTSRRCTSFREHLASPPYTASI